MMNGKVILIASVLSVLPAGCVQSPFSEKEFSGKEEISLYINGILLHEYIPETHQLGYNPSKNEIRICNDNMSDYFILDFDEMPSEEGQTVTATIEYTTADDIKIKKGLEFNVTKTDIAEGKIWLWSSKGKIGAVIPVSERLE